MNEIAKPTTGTNTASVFVVLAHSVSEICHRRELWFESESSIHSPVQCLQCFCCLVFCVVFNIHIPLQMLTDVLCDNKVLDLPTLGQLVKHILIETHKLLVCLSGIHNSLLWRHFCTGIGPHVWNHQRL